MPQSRRRVLKGVALAGVPGITGFESDTKTPADPEETYHSILQRFADRDPWAYLDRLDRIRFHYPPEYPLYQGAAVANARRDGASPADIVEQLRGENVEPADKQRLLDYKLVQENTVDIRLVDLHDDGTAWLEPYRQHVQNRLDTYYSGIDEDITVSVTADSVDRESMIDRADSYGGRLTSLLNDWERDRWDAYHLYLLKPVDYLEPLGYHSSLTGAGVVQAPEKARQADTVHDGTANAMAHEAFHSQHLIHNAYDGWIEENQRSQLRSRQLLNSDITLNQANSPTLSMRFEPGELDQAVLEQEFLDQFRAYLQPEIDLQRWTTSYGELEPANGTRPVDVAIFRRQTEAGIATLELGIRYNELVHHSLQTHQH